MVQDNGYTGCDQAAVRLEWRQGLSDRTRYMDDLDDPNTKSRAVETLRLGLKLGMTHIDTAEMYGDGHTEELVAEAIA